MSIDLHRLGEIRSVAYHRAVGDRIAEDGRLIEAARERVRDWLATGAVARPYALAWQELLSSPVDVLRERLVDGGERMTALRSCSPFGGVLDPRTRWQIFREERERAEANR